MINKILERGFIALAAYSYIFALISLILFVEIGRASCRERV